MYDVILNTREGLQMLLDIWKSCGKNLTVEECVRYAVTDVHWGGDIV